MEARADWPSRVALVLPSDWAINSRGALPLYSLGVRRFPVAGHCERPIAPTTGSLHAKGKDGDTVRGPCSAAGLVSTVYRWASINVQYVKKNNNTDLRRYGGGMAV